MRCFSWRQSVGSCLRQSTSRSVLSSRQPSCGICTPWTRSSLQSLRAPVVPRAFCARAGFGDTRIILVPRHHIDRGPLCAPSTSYTWPCPLLGPGFSDWRSASLALLSSGTLCANCGEFQRGRANEIRRFWSETDEKYSPFPLADYPVRSSSCTIAESQPTNQGVGSSNLSGRANGTKKWALFGPVFLFRLHVRRDANSRTAASAGGSSTKSQRAILNSERRCACWPAGRRASPKDGASNLSGRASDPKAYLSRDPPKPSGCGSLEYLVFCHVFVRATEVKPPVSTERVSPHDDCGCRYTGVDGAQNPRDSDDGRGF
jgi:hypothetical protein